MSAESLFDAARRRDLRLLLNAKGCPADKQHQIVDLACHAAEEAYAAFNRVLRSGGDIRVELTANGIAVSLLQLLVDSHLDGLKSFAAKHGIPIENTSIAAAQGGLQ
jgi:hypothetical protein